MEKQFGKILVCVKHQEAKTEDNEEATKIDSYAITWTVKRKDKLVPVVVGHIPREISRFTKSSLIYGRKINAKVFFFTIQTIPNPIRRA